MAGKSQIVYFSPGGEYKKHTCHKEQKFESVDITRKVSYVVTSLCDIIILTYEEAWLFAGFYRIVQTDSHFFFFTFDKQEWRTGQMFCTIPHATRSFPAKELNN